MSIFGQNQDLSRKLMHCCLLFCLPETILIERLKNWFSVRLLDFNKYIYCGTTHRNTIQQQKDELAIKRFVYQIENSKDGNENIKKIFQIQSNKRYPQCSSDRF